jgi:delta-aminolevulinic acid dehydratase/porphobilinogen synthase
MVKAAAAADHLDERAGRARDVDRHPSRRRDIVITYHAKDVATWLR